METTYTADGTMVGLGLLVGRLALGLLMAAHGSQKLFGWFGGPGLRATAEGFGHLGFRPGWLFAALAAGGEVVSGLLVALGLLGPVGPALMIALMIVAAVVVHLPHGLFAQNNGIELPLLYAAVALGLGLVGPGPYSMDAALGLAWAPALTGAVLGAGVVGGVGNLLVRRT